MATGNRAEQLFFLVFLFPASLIVCIMADQIFELHALEPVLDIQYCWMRMLIISLAETWKLLWSFAWSQSNEVFCLPKHQFFSNSSWRICISTEWLYASGIEGLSHREATNVTGPIQCSNLLRFKLICSVDVYSSMRSGHSKGPCCLDIDVRTNGIWIMDTWSRIWLITGGRESECFWVIKLSNWAKDPTLEPQGMKWLKQR